MFIIKKTNILSSEKMLDGLSINPNFEIIAVRELCISQVYTVMQNPCRLMSNNILKNFWYLKKNH